MAKRLTEEEKVLIEEAREARRLSTAKTAARIIGVSVLAGAILVVATKRIFDEIFVEDDWSDVDWGEEDEDFGVY